MNNIEWIEQWYASHCDGNWEHQRGLTIGTLDNPGWSVRISLQGTPMVARPFVNVQREGESDWLLCRTQNGFFEGVGGPRNLDEILNVFRSWIESA